MNQQELESKVLEGVEMLKGTFADVAFNLAELLAEQEMLHPNQLMPKKAFIERFQKQIAEELADTEERLKKGPSVLLQALAEKSEGASLDADLIQDLIKLWDLASMIANDRERFIEELSAGKTIQEMAGISEQSLEKLYQAAKHVFEQKRFEQAALAFGFLTMLNSTKFAFWLGLGNSEYNLKNYDRALFAYAFVSRVHPEDYFCHIFSCRCYEAIGDLDNAINALEIALFVLGDNPEHRELQLNVEMQVKRLQLAQHKRGAV